MLEIVRAWFNRLPPYEIDLPIIVVDGLAYTPRSVLYEVERGTRLGARMQELLETGRFGTDEKALAKIRLREILSRYPDQPLVARLIDQRVFTPTQLLREIEAESGVGLAWIEGEVRHIRYLIRLR